MEESGIRTSSFCKNLYAERHFSKEVKPIKTPMSEGYHHEIYDSHLGIENDSAKYRSIIGCCI